MLALSGNDKSSQSENLRGNKYSLQQSNPSTVLILDRFVPRCCQSTLIKLWRAKQQMRIIAVALIIVFVCLPLTAQTRVKSRAALAPVEKPTAAPGQTLPLKRLILYSNGVAYFERRGTVTGHAEISLP